MVDRQASYVQMVHNFRKQFLYVIGGLMSVVIYHHNSIQLMHDYINDQKLIQQDHIE